MKPEEALQLIDRALATLEVNRQTHFELQRAVQILRMATQTKPKPKKDLPKKKE